MISANPDAPPSCEGASVYQGHIGLVADPADCKCDCGSPDGSCPRAIVDLRAYTSAACMSGVSCLINEIEVLSGQCKSVDSAACGTFWGIARVQTEGEGACAAMPTSNPPERTWAESVVACEPEASESCGADESCVPAGGAVCVFSPGEVACPDGPYNVQRVAYAGLDDDRSCSECTCAPATGVACTGTITTYTGESCTADAQQFAAPSTMCENVNATMQVIHLAYQANAEGGSCTPSGGMPIGTATANGPTTFCCLPQ